MASLTEFTDPLGAERAAHLLRRTTFGPTKQQIDDLATKTPAQAITDLFPAAAAISNPVAPIDTTTGSAWVTDDPADNLKPLRATGSNSEQDKLMDFYKAWHVDVMLQSGTTITERLTWFYHTHLPARWTVINSSEAIYYQNCIYRYYSLRSFKDLFKKICVDNAMLRYLDGDDNKRSGLNENFAREMFELYSIGRGEQVSQGNYTNYKEDDIIEAAKVLTGWEFDDTFSEHDSDHGWPTGKLTGDGTWASQHDAGTKTFSSIFGGKTITPGEKDGNNASYTAAKAELDEMIEMIFEKDATSQFLIRKLYRSFVYHFISDDVENTIIKPLAAKLKDPAQYNYNISEALKELLKSQHFYDADDAVTANDNIGAIIKSPVDLSLSILRFFSVTTPDRITETATFYEDFQNGIIDRFEEQGLNYYEPFEVAGYPAYHQMPGFGRNWVMPKELAYRYQIGEHFMKKIGSGDEHTFKLDVLAWVNANSTHIPNPGNAEEVVNFFTTNLLAVTLNTDRKNFFLNTVFLEGNMPSNWTTEWTNYGGDPAKDTTVRRLLETLVSKIIQSPEFQLM